ncbi:MAG: tetratricopeptide repeat protein, partial [Nitrospiraceae bacterium]|nr:tetratricopeptide repeat protein [Nitrospiraceae bacterium]
MADELEKLKEKVQKDPNSRLFLSLAEHYKKAGMIDEALEVLTSGLERQPSYMSARVALGKIYLETGKLNEAKQEFEQVVKAIPDNLFAQRRLADIYLTLGEDEKAAVSLKAVLRLNPLDEEAVVSLKRLEAGSPQGGEPESLETAEIAEAEEAFSAGESTEEVFLPDEEPEAAQPEDAPAEAHIEGTEWFNGDTLDLGAGSGAEAASPETTRDGSGFAGESAGETASGIESIMESDIFKNEGEGALPGPGTEGPADEELDWLTGAPAVEEVQIADDSVPADETVGEAVGVAPDIIQVDEAAAEAVEDAPWAVEAVEAEILPEMGKTVVAEDAAGEGALDVIGVESVAASEEKATEEEIPSFPPEDGKTIGPLAEEGNKKTPSIEDADALVANGDYAGAVRAFMKILSASPGDRKALQRFEELKMLIKLLGRQGEIKISMLDG